MKVVPRAESLDAVQVEFKKDGKWPDWLEGHVAVARSPDGESIQSGQIVPIKDGDYLVDRGSGIDVMSAEEFDKEFRSVRPSRAKGGGK